MLNMFFFSFFDIHQGVLTVRVVKAPGASRFSRRGDLEKESVLVVESNDSCVGWNSENVHFLHACGLGHLLVCFNGRLVKIGLLNNSLGRLSQRRTNQYASDGDICYLDGTKKNRQKIIMTC